MINRMNTGSAQVALTSVDNVIAYAAGHGETISGSAPDLVAFMGGDHGFLSLVSRADVASVEHLKGRTLSVDGMTTGFTFVLREILSRNSLTATEVAFDTVGGTGNRYRALIAGKHDATLVRTPFERLAGRHGLKTLVAVKDLLPDYLGTVGAVLQSWASANRPGLIGFLLAYREALNWIFDEQNASACCAMLLAQFADLTELDTRAVYRDLVDPVHGLIHDMGIPDAGLAQVSRIRAAHAALPVNPAQPPCKDLQYLEEARASTRWAH